jgi:hypothetical protein
MNAQNNMTATEMTLDTILSNPVDKKILEGFIQEINLCQGKIREQRYAIKDILDEAKSKLGIKGRTGSQTREIIRRPFNCCSAV